MVAGSISVLNVAVIFPVSMPSVVPPSAGTVEITVGYTGPGRSALSVESLLPHPIIKSADSVNVVKNIVYNLIKFPPFESDSYL
jgi:hypothetical protein